MNRFKLSIVWLWVVIPLGWGVMKSAQKALPLFSGASPAKNSKPAK